MSNDEISRHRLSFAQAEGMAPLPTQLSLKEVSQELRARIWAVVYKNLQASKQSSIGYEEVWIGAPWDQILHDEFVYHRHGFSDEFSRKATGIIDTLGMIIKYGDYVDIFGLLQYIVRHPACPYQFIQDTSSALKAGRAAYRLIDKTIMPAAGDADDRAIVQAFDSLTGTEFNGARQHLRNAGEYLTAGEWGSSIHQSMNAVESVVRMLTDKNTVGNALRELGRKRAIHGGLRAGLENLYGYTSDEQGVRHSLLEQKDVNVDEADALFMFGACAAFVTYVVGKGRTEGIIGS